MADGLLLLRKLAKTETFPGGFGLIINANGVLTNFEALKHEVFQKHVSCLQKLFQRVASYPLKQF